MRVVLKEGVSLMVIPTKQFKTNRIAINLIAPLTASNLTKRLLLATLLETCCKKFSSQKAISDELARMYGASFEISSARKGNSHVLSIVFDCVNEKFLKSKEDLLEQGFSFLMEILFKPLADGSTFTFDEEFARQKRNLTAYFESIKDNKQLYAVLSLQNLFFNEEKQSLPSFGNCKELEQITLQDLYQYYLECLSKDKVEIIISGDLSITKGETLAKKLSFAPRKLAETSPFYYQQSYPLRRREERQPVAQGKLNLGFSLPVYRTDPLYYAVLVFDGLFGGLPLSKLFMNVREKSHLAYYASSSYDSFRGMMMVKTGLDSENKELAFKIIMQQLEEIKNGKITTIEIDDTKKALINEYLSGLDSQASVVRRAFTNTLAGENVTASVWIKKIQAVTLTEIQSVAKQTTLQAIYFLRKE
ncbi:EF-P 5-aminopentanol modification-associated protein YfmF [Liquorilactobacillus oeni]|uniref:Peptidase n=1 Tax=Liquorilactobacillus oeni DSM 19972 TaxID=1423777 RepID=A0A0R1M9G4_9LACO|nr:pitrilysin family protein [Liquorilactobacillus oeni]KRL04783.1 peptidase [Liquorilactobacillus oeni DSM 19972]